MNPEAPVTRALTAALRGDRTARISVHPDDTGDGSYQRELSSSRHSAAIFSPSGKRATKRSRPPANPQECHPCLSNTLLPFDPNGLLPLNREEKSLQSEIGTAAYAYRQTPAGRPTGA